MSTESTWIGTEIFYPSHMSSTMSVLFPTNTYARLIARVYPDPSMFSSLMSRMTNELKKTLQRLTCVRCCVGKWGWLTLKKVFFLLFWQLYLFSDRMSCIVSSIWIALKIRWSMPTIPRPISICSFMFKILPGCVGWFGICTTTKIT